MATRKSLTGYPKEYFELFRMASTKEIQVKHETKEQAESTRNDLYTFRQVLYSDPTGALAVTADAAQNVRLSVRDSTLTCEPIRIKKEKKE